MSILSGNKNGWTVSTRERVMDDISNSLDNPNNMRMNNILNGLNNSVDSISDPSRGMYDYSYAEDLIPFAPKYKFLFKVAFYFDTNYIDVQNKEFVYLVKNIDKPKVDFEYEEVNMYNYRTKVLKTVKNQVLSLEFIDDIDNKVMDFFNAYRMAYSPLASLPPSYRGLYEKAGMNFTDRKLLSANSGQLKGVSHTMLRGITVCQIFGHGTRANYFHFTNPKIEAFDFDNMDFEDGSTGNNMNVSFTYDSLYITTQDNLTSTPLYSWGRKDLNNSNDRAGTDVFALPVPGQSTDLDKKTSNESLNDDYNNGKYLKPTFEQNNNGWTVNSKRGNMGTLAENGWIVSTSSIQDKHQSTRNLVNNNIGTNDILESTNDINLEDFF